MPEPVRADTYTNRQLAVVTGASSGIGLELALECARNGYDLVLAADRPLAQAAAAARAEGARVETVEVDLATPDGVAQLSAALAGRVPDALLANAGHGLGHAFLDQDFAAIRHVVDTNVTGTLDLVHRIGRLMRTRGRGRILITGSIAGLMPGSFQAVYNGSKAFVDSFSWALRNELADTGVTVTCLMPGPTDTEFFDRAGLEDTQVGTDPSKDDPADVARTGFRAMQAGEGDVVSGFRNKVQAVLAHVVPSGVLAERHRKMAEPGSGRRDDA